MSAVNASIRRTCHSTVVLVAALGLLARPGTVSAQAAAATGTVRFVFLAPTADMEKAFGAGLLDTSFADGYSGALLTGANVKTFQGMAPPRTLHLYTELQPGRDLRRLADKVMTISGGNVDVWYFLIDDRTGMTGDTGIFSTNDDGGRSFVWPTATTTAKGGGRHDGIVRLGEHFGDVIATNRPGGVKALEGVALHETSHTQWVGEWSKWGAINQRAITYGADGDHYSEELLGDPNAAIDEGHGTFYGHMHNPPEADELYDWFTRADERYFVEARSVLAGQKELYTVKARRQGEVNGVTVFQYKWADVPGFLVPFSESTATAFYHAFWKRANNNTDQAFSMVIETSKAMWQDRLKRHLSFAVNRLALQLEAFAATPDGQKAKAAATATSSMFPFALLDILTHFGMSEQEYKADYDRRYPDRHPKAFVEYWNHRDAVKKAVQGHLTAAPIAFEEAIDTAHKYFQSAATILVP